MRFDRIRLRNFKPYDDADLRLDEGVTVIHGLNGSGKSSLLEACFFALYGAKALDETLDDVITTGEEEAEIELWFTHDGGEYHVERRLRRSGDRTQTATCVLEGPIDEVNGARDVRRRVTELLRMDAEAFVNCAYVRQGEVNKLINATPSQRQDMIDDLLQLGKLEEYRERASAARLGVNDVLADKRGRLSELDSQIDAKESQNLHERLNALQSELAELDEKRDRYEAQKRKAEETRDDAVEVLESYEEKREELATLNETIESLGETVTETENERDEHRERIGELRERADELEGEIATLVAETDAEGTDDEAVEARRATLDEREADYREDLSDARMKAQAFENQATNLASRADDIEERVAERRSRADELAAEADEAESDLDDRREKVASLDDRIDDLRATFDDAPADFGDAADHLAELQTELEAVRDQQREVSADRNAAKRRVEEAEELLSEGKCPECGQSVEESPHVETLDEDRARVSELTDEFEALADERADLESAIETAESLVEAESEVERLRSQRQSLETLLDERTSNIEEKRDEAERLRESADELEAEVTEKRTVAEEKRTEAETARERVDALESSLREVEEEREILDTVRERREDLSAVEDEIARRRERRETLSELNDERRDRLAEKRKRRTELRESVDDDEVETARADKSRAESYLEKVEAELDRLADRRDELQNELGGVKNAIDELERLREQREALGRRVDALESLYDETDRLETMYGDLRAELRQRNVESLERLLNETFDLVYGNDAYSRIRLDGEYELTVFQKDGTALDPEQLSGGERALFNLSLRCAIYRLLAEGIDGAAPMPPLILDEPTVFLDSGHVSRLVDLVAEMRDLGVRQIIIVSHDDELVGAADDLVTVEKDPTSNRSSVHRVEAAALAAELADD